RALLAVGPAPGYPGGLLPGAGHRANLMNPGFREVGSGLAAQAGTGALYLTEDYGARAGGAFLMGVVYQDQDGNGSYGIGEGMGGVTVTASGPAGTFGTATWDAGGYQLQLPPGAYTVTFAGGGLPAAVTRA